MAARGADFLGIPFAHGFEVAALGRHHAVDRAVNLMGLEFFESRRAVVKDLQLHAGVSCVTSQGRADAQAVVRAGRELELEAQDEIIKLMRGKQICFAAVFFADQHTALHHVALSGSDPTGKVLAVK